MIKTICDSCKKEINNKNFICFITIRKMATILIKGSEGPNNMANEVKEEKFDICEECWNEVDKAIRSKQ